MAEAEVVTPRVVRNMRVAHFHSIPILALDMLDRFARALALEHRLLGCSGTDPETDRVICAAETAWSELAQTACMLVTTPALPLTRPGHAPVLRLAAMLALGAAAARDAEDARERFGRLIMASEALTAQLKSAANPAARSTMLLAIGVLHSFLWQAAWLEADLAQPACTAPLLGFSADARQGGLGPVAECGSEADRPESDLALD